METVRPVGPRWAIWAIAWGLLFAGLFLFLPPGPVFRFAGLGPLHLEGFADPETLVASLGPAASVAPRSFVLMNLQHGTIRRLDLAGSREARGGDDAAGSAGNLTARSLTPGPGVPLAGRPAGLLSTRFEDDGRQPRGWLNRCRVAGERLILLDPLVDRVQVEIWNSRTGEQDFERIYPWCETWVLGDRLAIEWRDAETRQARLDLIDLASGRIVPTRFPAEQVSLSSGQASADGQYFVQRFKAGRVRVWRVESGEEVFRGEADQFAISSDSRRLATMAFSGSRSWRKSGAARPASVDGAAAADTERTLRIRNLATGEILAERRDTVPIPHGWLDGDSGLSFHDGGRCLAIAGSRFQTGTREIDLWCWDNPAEELRRHRSIGGLVGPIDLARRGEQAATGAASWGVVIEGNEVLDAATGSSLSRFPGIGTQWANGTAGWGVIRSGRQSPSDDVADLVAPWSGDLAALISHRGEPRLYDLAAGRPVAWLGDDVAGFRYSPDAHWLVTQSSTSLDVWSLPPRRDWFWPILLSLTVPALALVRQIRRGRRTTKPSVPG